MGNGIMRLNIAEILSAISQKPIGSGTEATKRGLEQVLITCNTENAASFAVITKALKLYGGEQLSDSTFDGKNYHRVWINTKNRIRQTK